MDTFQDIATNCKGMISVLELGKKDNAKVVLTSNSGIYVYSREPDLTRMIDCTMKIQSKSNFTFGDRIANLDSWKFGK
jgi:hypothetical protein